MSFLRHIYQEFKREGSIYSRVYSVILILKPKSPVEVQYPVIVRAKSCIAFVDNGLMHCHHISVNVLLLMEGLTTKVSLTVKALVESISIHYENLTFLRVGFRSCIWIKLELRIL